MLSFDPMYILCIFLIFIICFLIFIICLLKSKNMILESKNMILESKNMILESKKNGSRWTYLKDFSWQYLPSANSTSFRSVASRVSTVFERFCPTGPGFEVAAKGRRRSWKIEKPAVNSKLPYQVAHLGPHSEKCNSAWKPVFDPLITANRHYAKAEILDMVMYGFRARGTNSREDYSGIIENPLNMLALPHQFEGMDQKTALALIPLEIDGQPVTIDSIMEWNGQAFSALILIHTAEDAINYFGFNADNAGDPPVVEMSSNDPLIKNAINVFNEFLLLITACLAVEDIVVETRCEAKVELCRMFRDFVAQKSTRTIPCLQLPKRAGLVKVQHFPRLDVMTPKTSRDQVRRRRSSSTLHFSSPHTFLLVLRALNCCFDWIHLNRIWPDWNKHFDRNLLRKTKREQEALQVARLVLLPSCCDVNALKPDCVICKCHILLNRPDAYPEVPYSLIEAAQMLVYRQVEPCCPDCEGILQLEPEEDVRRKSLVYCRRRLSSVLSTSDTAKGDY